MALKTSTKSFQERVNAGIHNSFMRKATSTAQDRFQVRRIQAAKELGNWEEWRSLGKEIRQHVLDNLDYYLFELSENVAKRGGHVFFAKDAEEATNYIGKVISKKKAKKIVKAKSMVSEEIHLNATLEKLGCEVLETDLGEYILQIDNHDTPSHIIGPALHKNREQIRELFRQKDGYQNSDDPEQLAKHARKVLREKFLEAEVGITGCNFAVAETGSVTLVTNEGNADLSTSLPKTVITVMGMERIVPTFEELDILVSLLTRSAVGQRLSSYVTVLTGPKEEGDVDGPEEFHLVIVDNGRSTILGGEFSDILRCIRCGACVNACPVYRHIGGHAYGSVYSGPIGAVLTPLLGGYEDFKELPFSSTLCGACTEACPVKIPLHELLLLHRQKIVEKEKMVHFNENVLMKAYEIGASSPTLYKWAKKFAPSLTFPFSDGEKITKGFGPLKEWTKIRDLSIPVHEKDSFRHWFNSQWKGEVEK